MVVMKKFPNRVLVVGGTSGIGRQLAQTYLNRGCTVAVTGRRQSLLDELRDANPSSQLYTLASDVTAPQFLTDLEVLVERMGGLDLCIYAAGFGHNNPGLDLETEVNALRVNADAFLPCVIWCTRYWDERQQAGHFATISSVAGIRALGVAPAYSATKNFQAFYLKALRQLGVTNRSKVRYTSIHPGFVDTDFIKGHHYPMTLTLEGSVRCMVRGLDHRRNVVVVDGRWRMVTWLMHAFPAGLWTRLGIFFRGS